MSSSYGPGLYNESLIRLNRHTGEVMWYNTNWVSVSPAPDFCIYGDRLYKWEGAIGIPTHLVVIDLATGENLFFSDPVGGDADQEIPLTAGPDGTIYGQRDGGELWAITDEGDAFDIKWSYVPQTTGMGAYGNVGIGPDGSIYFPDGKVVVRLDPESGTLLNTSEIPSIYPNPCQDRFTLMLPDLFPIPAMATLSDLSGRILRQWTITNLRQDLVPEQLPGIYLLHIASKTGLYSVRIFIH